MKLSERDFAAKMAVHRGKMCPLPKRSVRYVLAPVLAGHPSAAMSKGRRWDRGRRIGGTEERMKSLG